MAQSGPSSAISGTVGLPGGEAGAPDSDLLVQLQKGLLAEAVESAIELDKARLHSEELLHNISEICGFLAHDFNNYLSIISMHCEALVSADEQQRLRARDAIARAAERGKELASSLISLSRNEEGKTETVAVDSFVLANYRLLAAAAGGEDRLKLNLGATGSVIRVESSALSHALVNLVINARKALRGLRDDGIEISTRVDRSRPQPMLHLAVGDNGVGVSVAMRDRLFSRFATDRLDGVGLGLASADYFCRKYGGHIAYRPAEVTGSVFTLLLPVASQDQLALDGPNQQFTGSPAPAATAANAVTAPDPSTPMPSVLIVDDEADALEAMSELLANVGCRVASARSFGDAWAAWGDTPFDIVFIDASLQCGEQADFMAWARERNPTVSIGAISGSLSRLTATPHYDFALPKPLSRQMLTFVIDKYRAHRSINQG